MWPSRWWRSSCSTACSSPCGSTASPRRYGAGRSWPRPSLVRRRATRARPAPTKPARRHEGTDMQLATLWFLLIGFLFVGYAILDGFDLGVGAVHLIVARDDTERRQVLNAIGPVWDGNEVWLITGGGALFAAFPFVYATVFSAMYLALVLVLLALIGRAVAIEFRSKEQSPTWRNTWDMVFFLGSALPSLLFGVAFGNILRGLPLDQVNGQLQFAGGFFGLLN